MLSQKIFHAQCGDQQSMQELIDQFTPLIKRHSRTLYIEDAFNELLLAFIEIIHAVPLHQLKTDCDGALVKYIETSVRHSAIALIRKKVKSASTVISWEELSEAQKNELYCPDFTNSIAFDDLLNGCPQLTDRESVVLRLIYFYGYTSADIAQKFNKSKQNINQIKLRALKKLKKIYNL